MWFFSETELAEHRADAESRMLDWVAIEEETGTELDQDPQSPTYGEEVTTYSELFQTKARIKVIGSYGFDQEVGGRTATQTVRECHIPVSSPDVPDNTWVRPITLHPTTDQTLAGKRARVDGPAAGSQTTARRLKITEIVS